MILLLDHHQAPGDSVVATAAVRSLLDQDPELKVLVKGTAAKDVYLNMPRVEHYQGQHYNRYIKMHNDLIGEAHLMRHFLHSYAHTLSRELGYDVKLRYNRPQILLSKEEQGWISRVHELKGESVPYWVVNLPGMKTDFTVKRWPRSYMQEVISKTPDLVWVQVGQLHHAHTPLDGVINELGRTDTRQLIRMIAHPDCRGVVTGESLCHHLAAAFQKPCVTIASGWLPTSWVSYPNATILDRIGCLPCCRSGGCGKSRVVALDDNNDKNKKLCTLPVLVDEDWVGRCMSDITADDVVAAIERYRRGGVA